MPLHSEETKARLAVIRQQEVGLERQLSLYQPALEGQEVCRQILIPFMAAKIDQERIRGPHCNVPANARGLGTSPSGKDGFGKPNASVLFFLNEVL